MNATAVGTGVVLAGVAAGSYLGYKVGVKSADPDFTNADLAPFGFAAFTMAGFIPIDIAASAPAGSKAVNMTLGATMLAGGAAALISGFIGMESTRN
jgi:succinate-acetate transporter protein